MKKIIFLFTFVVLVVAIAVISGYKQSALNEMAEKHTTPSASKEFKSNNKSDVNEFRRVLEYSTLKNGPESKPKILLMLTNDTGHAAWSPALWWSYHHSNTGKPGC
jgi:hypothetical protein